jgi:hypothetical protein
MLTLVVGSQAWAQGDADPSQMVGRAQDLIGEMLELFSATEALAEEASEEEEDLEKTRCIDQKLASIEGYIRLAEESLDALTVALSSDDSPEHQYGLIVISSQRVTTLHREANACAGEILTFSGDTEHTHTVDESIPNDEDLTSDLDDNTLNRLITDYPLPEVTPFQ